MTECLALGGDGARRAASLGRPRAGVIKVAE